MNNVEKKDAICCLVKTTHNCNFDCEYCYDKRNRLKHGSKILSLERIKKLIDITTDYANHVEVIWHGGEPLCVPLDVYKEAQKYFFRKYKNTFGQSVQTNGSLLDEKWANFLHDYNISIGVSYDGKDTLRVGTERYDIPALLVEHKDTIGSPGIISVINTSNIDKMVELYKEIEDEAQTTNICFNHVFHKNEDENEFIMSVDRYEKGMSRFLDWLYVYTGGKERTAALDFETMFGYQYNICTHEDCRNRWFSIGPDGIIFPCDRWYPDRYNCGNIDDIETVDDIFNSDGYMLYASEVEQKYINHCYKCPYFYHCKGGCNANSVSAHGTASALDEDACFYFKKRFNLTYTKIRSMDIYKKDYNPYFVNTILEKELFTPLEIKNAIAKVLNIVYDFAPDEEIVKMDENLHYTLEYRLFRFFNPFKNIKMMNASNVNPDGYPFGVFEKNHTNLRNVENIRTQKIEQFIEDNKIEIFNIIKGGNNV